MDSVTKTNSNKSYSETKVKSRSGTSKENSNSNGNNLINKEIEKENEKSMGIAYESYDLDNKSKTKEGSITYSTSEDIVLEDYENMDESSTIHSELNFLFSTVHIICIYCGENFVFNFFNKKYISAECGCKIHKNDTLNNFINNHAVRGKKREFGCDEHNHKKYLMYCKDCKCNLCEDCLLEKSKFNNDNGKHTKHETHTKVDLASIKTKFGELEDIIQNVQKMGKFDKSNKILYLINNLISHYDEVTSYSVYKTLENTEKFLLSNMNNTINQKSGKNDKKYEELNKISSIKQLNNLINSPQSIYKIKINGEKTGEKLIDLSLFQNKKFNELKILTLNNVRLKSISALSSCSFPKLKRLDFECNELTDDCLEVLDKIELPEIKILNLFDNKITSPRIFEVINKFKTLKSFFIGKNAFNIKELKTCVKYELNENLEELGITNNFTKETYKFILNLNLENIKILYVQGNGFTSFELFENIKFKKLEEFWSRGTIDKGYLEDINEIMHFQGKETIKNIVLKVNKIKNIEKLIEIIQFFPNLKFLNIEDNGIEKERCEKVLNKIKSIKGFEDFVLKY